MSDHDGHDGDWFDDGGAPPVDPTPVQGAGTEPTGDEGGDWFDDQAPGPAAQLSAVSSEGDQSAASADGADDWLSGSGDPVVEGPLAAPSPTPAKAPPGGLVAWVKDHQSAVVIGGVVVLIVVILGVSISALTGASSASKPGSGDDDAGADAVVAVSPTTPARAADTGEICDDKGDRSTPEGTVAAFQHAYYHDRDADAVNNVFAPDARLDPQALEEAFSALPDDAGYCLTVTKDAAKPDRVRSVVRQTGSEEVTFAAQVVSLKKDGEDRWIITKLDSEESR